MAGMVPSPTGRANPYGQITAQNNNPAFGQIMRYQLGRQTNQSAEEINRNRDYMALLNSTINNTNAQNMRGPAANLQFTQAIANGGSGIGRTGLGVTPSTTFAESANTNLMLQQVLSNAKMRAEVNKTSATYGGDVIDPGGFSRKRTPEEILNTLLQVTARTPKISGDSSERSGSVNNKVVSYGPGLDAQGNPVVKQTTNEVKTKAKVKSSSTDKAEAILVALCKNNPSLCATIKNGYLTVKDNNDGTADILLGGTFVQTISTNIAP